MGNSEKIESATTWLGFADNEDYENSWKHSSSLFQSAIELDDWRKSLKAARGPLGALVSRENGSVEDLKRPDGAPDGNYAKVSFKSSFENKESAIESVTLIEEKEGQWRTAGYFIK